MSKLGLGVWADQRSADSDFWVAGKFLSPMIVPILSAKKMIMVSKCDICKIKIYISLTHAGMASHSIYYHNYAPLKINWNWKC